MSEIDGHVSLQYFNGIERFPFPNKGSVTSFPELESKENPLTLRGGREIGNGFIFI